ncbi:unnamed protein product [Closterium sp. NIES-54]
MSFSSGHHKPADTSRRKLRTFPLPPSAPSARFVPPAPSAPPRIDDFRASSRVAASPLADPVALFALFLPAPLQRATGRSMEGSNQRSPEQREPRGSPFRAGATWIHAGATREPTGGARGACRWFEPWRLELALRRARSVATQGRHRACHAAKPAVVPSLTCCRASHGADVRPRQSLPMLVLTVVSSSSPP